MPSKHLRERLGDILENIDRIRRYASGLGSREFASNALVVDAVERCLLRISEAAAKLGDVAESLMPEQPWPAIRSIGNVLRHEYDGIDPIVIWRTVDQDLEPLKRSVERALASLPPEEE